MKEEHPTLKFAIDNFFLCVTLVCLLLSVIVTVGGNSYDLSQIKNRNYIIEEEFATYKKEREKLIGELTRDLSILEEAVNAKDKRLATIRHVRGIILRSINQEKIPNKLTPSKLTEVASSIVDYSESYDVSMSLIAAVIRQESAYNPQAISHAGAQGLMQLMPDTASECIRELNVAPNYNPHGIRGNVQLGTWYLWKMLKRFDGKVDLAVRAYNAGPTLVKRVISGEIENYPVETVNYVKKVLEYKEQYEKMGL